MCWVVGLAKRNFYLKIIIFNCDIIYSKYYKCNFYTHKDKTNESFGLKYTKHRTEMSTPS